MAHFSSQLKDNNAWRIPLACFYLIPTIVASGIWFIPESPRYLLFKGHEEKARRALKRIRVDNTDEAIEREIEFISLGIAAHEHGEKASWASLFSGTTRRRTLITIWCTFFLQW